MKTKIIIFTVAIAIVFMANIKCLAQDYDYIMMQNGLQQAQDQVNKIMSATTAYHDYICYDGKKLSCFFSLSRILPFSIATAYIQKEDGSLKQNLFIDGLGTASIYINTRDLLWNLSYGDRIIFYFDDNVSESLDVGIDDKLTRESWKDFSSNKVIARRNELQQKNTTTVKHTQQYQPANYGGNSNYNSGRTRQQIQWELTRQQELLRDCERRRDETSSSSIAISYNSQIVSLQQRIQQLQQELIQAK